MTRENLRTILNNPPLIEIITRKIEAKAIIDRLHAAMDVMTETGVDQKSIEAVTHKRDIYRAIKDSYSNLLEYTFDLRWQDEAIVRRYIDIAGDNDAIDQLPDTIRDW